MKVSKYHGCENTFLITLFYPTVNYSDVASKLCSKTSYDADGLIVLKTDPIEMLVFNRDGSEASMCANGIRCLMHYCYDNFKIYKYLKIKTKNGYIKCNIETENPFTVTVNMGIPEYVNGIINKVIVVKERIFYITVIKAGVLHTVIFTENFDDCLNYAAEISNHSLFFDQTNVDFVRVIDNSMIEVVTYERGVGWTKSCGTGAVASAYVAQEQYGLNKNLTVITAGGILKVKIDDSVYLTGPSCFVKEFEVEI